ncbi:hypothetical protein LCGC14_2666080 [marine sediment metagenome]|uniref:LamG-like jellyroll fold domain-containing protein n=1 Tax=marine sediment metagenome TaxID=412755 RepID=A0A0F8ZQK6_9ZZZZ
MGLLSSPALKHVGRFGPKFRPDANTVLWLPGQKDPFGSQLTDESGKKNHGTITGSVWAKTPKGLSYVLMDGDDKITIANDASLNMGAGDFSIAFWWNSSSVAGIQQVLAKLDAGSPFEGYSFRTANISGRMSFNQNPDSIIAEEALNVNDGIWRLFHGTYDASDGVAGMKLYRNGAEVASAAAVATNIDNANSLFIGVAQDGASFPVTGASPLVTIWKGVVRTAEQCAGDFRQERGLFGV